METARKSRKNVEGLNEGTLVLGQHLLESVYVLSRSLNPFRREQQKKTLKIVGGSTEVSDAAGKFSGR